MTERDGGIPNAHRTSIHWHGLHQKGTQLRMSTSSSYPPRIPN